MISVDRFGWLERLLDGPKADRYNRVIDRQLPAEIVTSAVTIYEVYKKMKRAVGELEGLEAVAALEQTRVVPLDAQLALESADYGLAHRLHFADSILYATARRFDAVLYTSDDDLEDLPGVTVI